MSGCTVVKKIAAALLLSLSLSGCATTFVPISWNYGEKVQQLSRSDLTLAVLFNRYDPARETLRVSGESFDEVMMPSEVKYHLGAYRRDKRMIYRNMYQEFTDRGLRDLMVHEFAHHIWFSFMSPKQRDKWAGHLDNNPAPIQAMVRRVYPHPEDYATEDFAFTVEYARPVDIRELARLGILSTLECDTLLSGLAADKQTLTPKLSGGPSPSAPAQSQAAALDRHDTLP